MSPRTQFEVLAGIGVLVLLAAFGIIAHLLVSPLGLGPVAEGVIGFLGGGFIGWAYGRWFVVPRRQAFAKRNSE